MKKFLAVLLVTGLVVPTLSGCKLLDREGQKGQEPMSADSVLDDQIYQNAMASGQASDCENIEDSSKKEECVNVVEAKRITAEAIAAADKSKCGDIKLDRYEEYCESTVKSAEDQAKEDAARQESHSKAVATGDQALCDSIKDGNQKNSCKINTVLQKAIDGKSIEICNELKEESNKKSCMGLYQQ